MSLDVYIKSFGIFLPNNPVTNESIDDVLGAIGVRETIKKSVLRNNGIKSRYYAIDPVEQHETGVITVLINFKP